MSKDEVSQKIIDEIVKANKKDIDENTAKINDAMIESMIYGTSYLKLEFIDNNIKFCNIKKEDIFK